MARAAARPEHLECCFGLYQCSHQVGLNDRRVDPQTARPQWCSLAQSGVDDYAIDPAQRIAERAEYFGNAFVVVYVQTRDGDSDIRISFRQTIFQLIQ